MPKRQMFLKRIGPTGDEIDCDNEDEVRYVDIAETKKAWYERGRGASYQKTVYKKERDGATRVFEDEPLVIKNPDDEDEKIEYSEGVIKKLKWKRGRGASYQAKWIKFDNTKDNERRKVRTQTVRGKMNNAHRIDVERIKDLFVEGGRGAAFWGKKVRRQPNDTEEIFEDVPCEPKE
jgi:hypothetical protein